MPLGDPGLAIGQCRSGGITVATVAPAHGADNVVPDKEDSGGPPQPHPGYPMWASKKTDMFVCLFEFIIELTIHFKYIKYIRNIG